MPNRGGNNLLLEALENMMEDYDERESADDVNPEDVAQLLAELPDETLNAAGGLLDEATAGALGVATIDGSGEPGANSSEIDTREAFARTSLLPANREIQPADTAGNGQAGAFTDADRVALLRTADLLTSLARSKGAAYDVGTIANFLDIDERKTNENKTFLITGILTRFARSLRNVHASILSLD